MSEVNNNPDRHELGSGDGIHKTVMGSMTIEELKTLLYPLNNKDVAIFLGISESYLKKMMTGEREIQADYINGRINKDCVLGFFRDSPSARKSRQQARNKLTYKEFISLMGSRFNKCSCCLYPAHKSIYGRYLCEECVRKMKIKTVDENKEDLTED